MGIDGRPRSVLDTYKEIHRTFDLKGSSLGRSAKDGEKVLKDNDLAAKQGKLHLGSQREAFLKVGRKGWHQRCERLGIGGGEPGRTRCEILVLPTLFTWPFPSWGCGSIV